MESCNARRARHPGVRIGFICVIAVITFGTSWAHSGPKKAPKAPTVLDMPDPSGVLRTISVDGSGLDMHGAFFQSLGSNGRSCASCHVPSTGWTISPPEVRDRFDKTKGLDPIFRTNDGSNSPHSNIS